MSHDAHAETEGADVGFHPPHIVPGAVFLRVLMALLVLTGLTVLVGQFDFGSANMFVAMGIAAVKASLVMTFFMHLKYDTAMNNIAFISSFLFLSLLFIFTLADFTTRDMVDPILGKSAPLEPRAGEPGAGWDHFEAQPQEH